MASMKNPTGYNAPAENAFSVTPNDSTDMANAARALFVGGAGDVKVDTTGGDTVTFTGVTAGMILPVRVTRVYATGTTATNIVAVY